ncbi:MAG: permease [Synergistaceae bacterium]|nr:permease [Synergistaceae bacterium]MBQ6114815.1 permease [Synergistaceae bacterium]MBQ6417794.1 permease [Synergistaceae bacterium]MBQ6664796.1 permease [Synergistaceae bacterium]MBQ6982227.1 permease [Synergistaceae bacterium]
MTSILRREAIYLWYYFTVQLDQIYAYWLAGMAIGSFVSVFGKQKIHALFEAMNGKRLSLFGIVPACLLGIASPLCMYGTIPIAASFSEKGMREDWLASFMMASVLLNPQLIVYSSALGTTALTVRIVSCFMCGIFAGLAVNLYGKITGRSFFTFGGFYESSNRDTDPNILIRYIKNFGRNVKATGGYFLLGIVLSAMFMRYVPAESFARLFGRKNGFGVLMAATIGVPLYACGGGTIPLLQMWLADGMSMASASAFMITGPATKITNLGALKIVLGGWKFVGYLAFVIIYSLLNGLIVDLIV